MKAISLWQPWATAIALGLKQIETRGRLLRYRGLIAIHAAQTRKHSDFLFAPDQRPAIREVFTAAGYVMIKQLPFGSVVAVAEVYDCRRSEDLLAEGLVSPEEAVWGNYGPGRFGWLLRDVRRLETPIPWRGSQGFFSVPDERLAA